MLSVTPSHWPYLPRLLLTVAYLRIVTVSRHDMSAGAFALFLVAMLIMPSFASIWLAIGWLGAGFGFGVAVKHTGPRIIFGGLLALLTLHMLAIPGSIIWGSGNWELTAWVVFWIAPGFLIYSAGTSRVLSWLAPAFLLHAGIIIYHGFTNWHWTLVNPGDYARLVLIQTPQPLAGLAHNENIAAGFLAIGIVYFMTGPYKWLSAPLLMALLFTGSRWGLVVVAAVLVAMVVTRSMSWQPLALGVGVVVGTVLLIGLFTPSPYTVASYNSIGAALQAAESGVNGRLAIPHLPSLLPSGVAEHPGLHNVPLRIAVESGILAAVIWVVISGWALIRDRLGREWWLLLTLVLLSMLDYYSWMGHLGGFWWLFIGLLVRSRSDRYPQEGQVTQAGGNDLAPDKPPEV
jgi:hypothetical protein